MGYVWWDKNKLLAFFSSKTFSVSTVFDITVSPSLFWQVVRWNSVPIEVRFWPLPSWWDHIYPIGSALWMELVQQTFTKEDLNSWMQTESEWTLESKGFYLVVLGFPWLKWGSAQIKTCRPGRAISATVGYFFRMQKEVAEAVWKCAASPRNVCAAGLIFNLCFFPSGRNCL